MLFKKLGIHFIAVKNEKGITVMYHILNPELFTITSEDGSFKPNTPNGRVDKYCDVSYAPNAKNFVDESKNPLEDIRSFISVRYHENSKDSNPEECVSMVRVRKNTRYEGAFNVSLHTYGPDSNMARSNNDNDIIIAAVPYRGTLDPSEGYDYFDVYKTRFMRSADLTVRTEAEPNAKFSRCVYLVLGVKPVAADKEVSEFKIVTKRNARITERNPDPTILVDTVVITFNHNTKEVSMTRSTASVPGVMDRSESLPKPFVLYVPKETEQRPRRQYNDRNSQNSEKSSAKESSHESYRPFYEKNYDDYEQQRPNRKKGGNNRAKSWK